MFNNIKFFCSLCYTYFSAIPAIQHLLISSRKYNMKLHLNAGERPATSPYLKLLIYKFTERSEYSVCFYIQMENQCSRYDLIKMSRDLSTRFNKKLFWLKHIDIKLKAFILFLDSLQVVSLLDLLERLLSI